MMTLERIRCSRRTRRALVALLALLSARLLVPVGYMPAPLGAGGIMLCHDASAATLALLGDAHAGSMHDSDGDTGLPAGHEAWERCSFGVGPADAAIVYVSEALVSAARPLFIAPPVVARLGETRRSHYSARAPPV